MTEQQPTPPTTEIQRLDEYQVRERDQLAELLDRSLVAHVAGVHQGHPVVLPFACARDGDRLLLHGSTGSGIFRAFVDAPVAVEVTQVDGLVFARSLFESSLHYQSAVIYGIATRLTGDDAVSALDVLSNHLMPGRTDELRTHTRKELAGTLVLSVPMERWSLKVGDGPAHDPDDGEPREVWAGILPFGFVARPPMSAPDEAESLPVPDSVRRAAERFSTS